MKSPSAFAPGDLCKPGKPSVYHFFRQLWLVLGVKLMEINSNLFSRKVFFVFKLLYPRHPNTPPEVFGTPKMTSKTANEEVVAWMSRV